MRRSYQIERSRLSDSLFDGRPSDMGRLAMPTHDQATINYPCSPGQTFRRWLFQLIAISCLVTGFGVVFVSAPIVPLGTSNAPDGMTSASGGSIHPAIVATVPHQPINHTWETEVEGHHEPQPLLHNAH